MCVVAGNFHLLGLLQVKLAAIHAQSNQSCVHSLCALLGQVGVQPVHEPFEGEAAVVAHLHVAHQARAEDHDRVVQAYADAGIAADVQPFFDDVPQRLADCQLVISRAGASSVADITAIGRPSILIPYAAASGDHQSANARPLADAGAAIVLPESVLDAESLTRDIAAILSDADRASDMAEAARTLGRPDAARRLYDLVTELAP